MFAVTSVEADTLLPGSAHTKTHWLDSGLHTHSPSVVNDVIAVWRILSVFACLPLFWALFDQQVSRYPGCYSRPKCTCFLVLPRKPFSLSSARTGGMALLCEMSSVSLAALVSDIMWQLFEVALMSCHPYA